jgi:hypothetical protein
MIPVHGCQLFWESGAPHPARGCFSPSFLVSELSERAHRAMQWIYVPASGGITKHNTGSNPVGESAPGLRVPHSGPR